MQTAKAHVVIVVVTGLLLVAATVAVVPLMRASASCGSALTGMTQSFRTSKFGWNTWQHDSRVSLTSTDVRSRPHALLVTAGSGTSAMWHVPASNFVSTGTYMFSGYAKLATGSGQLHANAQAFTSQWALMRETDFGSQPVRSDAWTLVSGSFSVPAGATNLDINFSGLPASWRLDDVSLALQGSSGSSCGTAD